MGDNTKTEAMVGDNTNDSSSDDGQLILPLAVVGDNTKGRSPLLPARHQPDFFVCDIFDAAFKGDSASMEHPIFSLSKKPDFKVRRYQNGDHWAEVRPSVKGLATVFDRDILIYCISQLVAALNDGRPISRRIQLRAHDLMVATNRDTSGQGYIRLREALERLQGTQIATNVTTGGKEIFDIFGLINRARVVRETRDGRMQEVEIELSDWVFHAVEAQEVLTLDRRYFQLAKPLERRLYELARKHCGNQQIFKISIEKLKNKCGSQSTLKEFRRMLQTIIEDDQLHDHIPGYALAVQEDLVEITPKLQAKPSAPHSPAIALRSETYSQSKDYAPGWDVYALEAQWRDWLAKKHIRPSSPDAHFLAFCKRRGKYPGFR